MEKLLEIRKKWTNYIVRNNSYLVTLSEGKVNGGRMDRGRPRKDVIKQIGDDVGAGSPYILTRRNYSPTGPFITCAKSSINDLRYITCGMTD